MGRSQERKAGVRAWFLCLWVLLLALFISPAQAADVTAAFDQANKLYEQGKFTEAAAAYEKLTQDGQVSATVYFNLGNAWFKAGQNGRAIAAYLQAEQLSPRDPNLRFNLQFVRQKVTGSEATPGTAWQRALAALTLNEWTALLVAAFWLWFLLLALREVHPNFRRPLRLYAGLAGLATLALGGCLAAAAYDQAGVVDAVVVVPDAVVRYGPLEESHVSYQLRDGSEVVVLDEKQFGDKQTWLQVRDAGRRIGWLKRDQVVVLKF